MTPQQFLEQQRLDRARQLLELSGRSIGDIAADVGFDNPFYFTLRFKRLTGLSPRDYRKRLLVEHELGGQRHADIERSPRRVGTARRVPHRDLAGRGRPLHDRHPAARPAAAAGRGRRRAGANLLVVLYTGVLLLMAHRSVLFMTQISPHDLPVSMHPCASG